LIRADFENILALQFEHRRDLRQNFRNTVFVHFSHAQQPKG
jgi:hypothetical protein